MYLDHSLNPSLPQSKVVELSESNSQSDILPGISEFTPKLKQKFLLKIAWKSGGILTIIVMRGDFGEFSKDRHSIISIV